jgi:phosphohistidine phosphatase SixA
MKFLSAILALAMGIAATAQPAQAQSAFRAGPDATTPLPPLIDRLRQGGLLLVIRHERTEIPSREDDFGTPRTDCLAQRNLSAAGHAGARETGAALRALGIAVAEVRASPICRTMDTARLMFDRAVADERLMHDDPPRGRTAAVADADIKAAARSVDLSRGNVALVTHGGIIAKAFGTAISEGGILIVERRADGRFVALGHTTGSDLGFPARARLADR